MFVPIVVPAHSGHTTVINKTIVYSDTVLNLKERGGNLKVTSVEVDKYLFESCVKMILEENPDVVFNTIQYSYQQEKAIFYTDKPISIGKWKNRNLEKKEYLTDASSIETHIKELLASNRILNPDCISLYDVLSLSKIIQEDEETFQKSIEECIECKLKYINDDIYVIIDDMNYKTDECKISVCEFCWTKKDSREKISFKKKGNDVYISKRDGDYVIGDEILGIIGDEISALYDYQQKMKYKEDTPTVYAKTVNSGFFVSMGYYGVDIYNGRLFDYTFKMEMSSYSNEIDYNCNSSNLLRVLNENAYELCKKIFVKISDCPYWMQEKLMEIRKNQLIIEEKEREKQEQKRVKEEYKKVKKEKRREFLKKIFPFVK